MASPTIRGLVLIALPCGTGTSARMATLHACGASLSPHTDFINDSYIGSRFIGRLIEETEVAGRRAVIPTITGRAWVTGTAQYMLDPSDPFPRGFLLRVCPTTTLKLSSRLHLFDRTMRAIEEALRADIDPELDGPRLFADAPDGEFLTHARAECALQWAQDSTMAPNNPDRGLEKIQSNT